MKDRTVSQFDKHLITIKSHIIILMECFKLTFIFHKEQSLSQTTSFKITQKEKGGERYGSMMNDCDCLWECCSIGDL